MGGVCTGVAIQGQVQMYRSQYHDGAVTYITPSRELATHLLVSRSRTPKLDTRTLLVQEATYDALHVERACRMSEWNPTTGYLAL